MSAKSVTVAAEAQLPVASDCPSPVTARVVVAGEVDLATAPMLRDRLFGVLRDRDPAFLVVDFAGVTFLDCAGIGALVGVRNAAVRTGCQLRVTNSQPFVSQVLKVTGLWDVFSAPADQPQHPSARSGSPSGAGPARAAMAVPVGAVDRSGQEGGCGGVRADAGGEHRRLAGDREQRHPAAGWDGAGGAVAQVPGGGQVAAVRVGGAVRRAAAQVVRRAAAQVVRRPAAQVVRRPGQRRGRG